MSEVEKLPKSWEITELGNYAWVRNGFAFKSSLFIEESNKSAPIIRISNIKNNKVNSNNSMHYEIENIPEGYAIESGDLLIAMSGATTGKVGIYYGELAHQNQRVGNIKLLSEKYGNKKYLGYILETLSEEIQKKAHGAAQPNISSKAIESFLVSIAPLSEQDRIVDKLEELFSELDAGVKELKAAQTKLSQYRQSLLKSAVEGSLTQQWRIENSTQVQETGEQLLARILKQRREQWQQQKLAEFAEKGKTPPKDWQDKYPEPVQPDTTDLPKLPEGWVWASMAQICQIQGGIQKQPKRRPVENKYPFLRVANVYRNELRLDEIHEIELFGDELQRLSLLKGDILIVEGNGSKSEIGRCAIWNNEIENAVHQNHLIRTRPILALSKYVALWLNSPAGMDIMSTLAATTSGLYTLSVSKISKIPVPIPSLSEQKVVADKIDSEFDSIDRQIEATALGLKQSEAQRKNILKSAFSGQLVQQDPNDEPASVLLEKIKQEREALAKMPKPRKPSQPKKRVELMNTLLEVLTAENDWIDAQDAFQKCGIVDGTSTDRIEEIYTELRKLEKAGNIQIQRQGNFDQLKLTKPDVKED
ncbi:restriction endonuclease subunit S [Shewanella sp. WE21]|uniref:restriction endonuclease subunit S n=1 Tax=Shewanella sp. WE21 TaxID=2029986 RepID=UPI000CF6ECF7|nr:restriction endonuclease subunit S [Shewanella sp. WE21]AVI64607.1 restriction endonuclease subunit S [Shewanella sp. WE21]